MSIARKIADQIQLQVEADGTPAGSLIGTEADLRLRLGVSLATLRQAVRILEQRQVAVMRRGVSGGLYAEQPSVDATANRVAALWERSDKARKAILHDAAALQAMTLRHASDRMRVADAAAIAALHADCRSARDPIVVSVLAARREQAIAQLTDNPVIVLGNAVTLRFLRNIIPFEELTWDDSAFAARMQHLVDAKISALVSGEIAEAIHASTEHLRAHMERLDSSGGKPLLRLRAETESQPGSLPILVSRAMLREIREHGWIAGEFLGQEPELMRKFKVGRNTWRQALSILLEYSAVESRRGGAGGLYVAPINRRSVMETAAAWLSRQGARTRDGLEVFATIAPHHAAAAFAADIDPVGGNASPTIDCGELLGRVLHEEASPLLDLAALTVAPSLFGSAPSIDLAVYRDHPSGQDLVKREVLDHLHKLSAA